VFVLAKVARVRFHYRVPGVPEVIRWQRWISWSMLVLYSAIFLSGVLLLLPIRGRLYADLTNFHLLTSFWALAPTTWHVWHYRRRAAPYLTRLLPRGRSLAYWGGLALALLPSVVVVANARSLSQLPQVLGGSNWSVSALRGSYLDRIAIEPDGTLLAAGDALYVSRDGTVWTQIDIPGVATPGPSPVHEHGAPTGKNLALAVAIAGRTIYVGTQAGLYSTQSMTGPLVADGFGGKTVYAITVDPSSPQSMWLGTSAALMRSDDGGASWRTDSQGIARPNLVSAITLMNGQLFASDTTAVYEKGREQTAWRSISAQSSVVDLTPDEASGRLYATSSSQGVEFLDGGTWHTTDSLASPHQHHAGNESHPEVLSVAVIEQRLYAVGTAFGVSASADDGQTWTQLGGGLENATASQAVEFDGAILAATSDGVYRFPLSPYWPASSAWWIAVLAATAVCGAAGVLLAAGTGLIRFTKR
jgi:hypothetical protein